MRIILRIVLEEDYEMVFFGLYEGEDGGIVVWFDIVVVFEGGVEIYFLCNY